MNRPSSNALEVTVTELSGKLKKTVEDTFGYVRVRGEISGFRGPHSSGHCYFSLKDERARLEAVIWRGQAAKLKHMPEEGLEVVASGKLTTYPGSSKYQIVIDNLEPAGAGALMARSNILGGSTFRSSFAATESNWKRLKQESPVTQRFAKL